MSDKVRPGYKSINIKLKVKGDVPEEKLQKLVCLLNGYRPLQT
jgi:uncharacterized OsmC-like protein